MEASKSVQWVSSYLENPYSLFKARPQLNRMEHFQVLIQGTFTLHSFWNVH